MKKIMNLTFQKIFIKILDVIIALQDVIGLMGGRIELEHYVI